MHLDDYQREYYEILTDKDGRSVKRLKEQSNRTSKEGEFLTFDTSHGHCELCGRISCNGGCFK